MKKITETFNTVTLKKGESFAIELPENGSTGFSWQASVTQGKATFNYSSNKFENRASVGGGTTRKFVFTAEQEGDLEITFEHKRPWENKPAAEVKHYRMKIVK